jgi:hypothetical protein
MSDIQFESTTSADGTEIGYFRRGAGPALVITHGSVSTCEQWIPATEHLAEHFTCFVHDRRARGRSGDAAAYELATEVADIAALMAVAGPGAHLLGHSYGALCTLAYAEHEALGGTLILFEPPLAVDGPVAGERLAGYRELVESGDLDAAFEYALVNFVRVPPVAVPEIRKTPLWGACVPLTLGPRAGADRRARRRPQALRVHHRAHAPDRRHGDDPVPARVGAHPRRRDPRGRDHRAPRAGPLRPPRRSCRVRRGRAGGHRLIRRGRTYGDHGWRRR